MLHMQQNQVLDTYLYAEIKDYLLKPFNREWRILFINMSEFDLQTFPKEITTLQKKVCKSTLMVDSIKEPKADRSSNWVLKKTKCGLNLVIPHKINPLGLILGKQKHFTPKKSATSIASPLIFLISKNLHKLVLQLIKKNNLVLNFQKRAQSVNFYQNNQISLPSSHWVP